MAEGINPLGHLFTSPLTFLRLRGLINVVVDFQQPLPTTMDMSGFEGGVSAGSISSRSDMGE